MKKDYKYDVAFSCAEEDLAIAQKIAASFRKKHLRYYLYTEHEAENLGQNIFAISLDKYKSESRYVLMLISDIYPTKHWSSIERQIAQTVERRDDAYIIPIQIGEKPLLVDGLSSNIIYKKWNDNPDEIAELIREKTDLAKNKIESIPGSKEDGVYSIAQIQNYYGNIKTINNIFHVK